MSLIKTALHRNMTDREFVDFLFSNLHKFTDTDMIDLHDDDSCCDHLEFQQLEIDI
tara:strand:- start:933 stop:1100 length:168 start_codon:yes stop_codon:yes gene_type:complete